MWIAHHRKFSIDASLMLSIDKFLLMHIFSKHRLFQMARVEGIQANTGQ